MFNVIIQTSKLPFRAENGTHWNCTGGAAKFIDVAVFGEEHIYQHPTSIQVYGGVAHDPEGLLGTLNRCHGLLFSWQQQYDDSVVLAWL